MKLHEAPNYDYLLNMPLHSLTEEKIEQLEKDYLLKSNEYQKVKAYTIKDLWKQDFGKF